MECIAHLHRKVQCLIIVLYEWFHIISYLFSFIVGNPSYFILTVTFFAKYAIHVPISWSCIRTAQFVFFFTLASCSGEKSSLLRTCSSCACALHSLWILFEFSFPVKSRLCLGSALLARQ